MINTVQQLKEHYVANYNKYINFCKKIVQNNDTAYDLYSTLWESWLNMKNVTPIKNPSTYIYHSLKQISGNKTAKYLVLQKKLKCIGGILHTSVELSSNEILNLEEESLEFIKENTQAILNYSKYLLKNKEISWYQYQLFLLWADYTNNYKLFNNDELKGMSKMQAKHYTSISFAKLSRVLDISVTDITFNINTVLKLIRLKFSTPI